MNNIIFFAKFDILFLQIILKNVDSHLRIEKEAYVVGKSCNDAFRHTPNLFVHSLVVQLLCRPLIENREELWHISSLNILQKNIILVKQVF